MSPLVQGLSRSNRKERYWLLADPLGEPFLRLSPSFLAKVGAELNAEVAPTSWWAFDYHLDWLHAVLSAGPDYDIGKLTSPMPNEPRVATGGQEDIDLLIAFDQTIILVEAKLTSSWTNKQMESKVNRLASLPTEHVQARLLLASVHPTSPALHQFPLAFATSGLAS